VELGCQALAQDRVSDSLESPVLDWTIHVKLYDITASVSADILKRRPNGAFKQPSGAHPCMGGGLDFLEISMTTTPSTSASLNEKMALVSISLSVFSGYRRASEENILALGGKLPKSAAVTEGSIKVFPNDALKDFSSIRRDLFRKIQAKGIRALGSNSVFAVARESIPQIEKMLAEADAKVRVLKADLESRYDALFEAHCLDNKEAEAIIRSLKVDKGWALSRIRFINHVFQICPLQREGIDEQKGVEEMVRGLARQLYLEVADSMTDTLLKHEGFAAGRLSQKSLRLIRAQSEKMKNLTFLHDSVAGSVLLIEDVLANMPSSGYIEGRNFSILKRLVSLMADADDMLSASAKRLAGEAAADVLFPPVVAPQKVSPFGMPASVPSSSTSTLARVAPLPGVAVARQAVASSQPRQLPPQRASALSGAGFKPQKLF
jgi:hypothetical protein